MSPAVPVAAAAEGFMPFCVVDRIVGPIDVAPSCWRTRPSRAAAARSGVRCSGALRASFPRRTIDDVLDCAAVGWVGTTRWPAYSISAWLAPTRPSRSLSVVVSKRLVGIHAGIGTLMKLSGDHARSVTMCGSARCASLMAVASEPGLGGRVPVRGLARGFVGWRRR